MTQAAFSVTHSAILHSIISVMSMYLFIVFVLWWMKQGRATVIYVLICFLLLGIFSINSGAAYLYIGRWITEDFSLPEYLPFLWSFRNYFMLIPLSIFAWHVTRKISVDRQLRQLMIEDATAAKNIIVTPTKTILVVDDNVDVLKMVAKIFRGTRFQAAEAHNGAEALALLVKLHPSIVCIVLDLVLDEMSGWDVLREVRKVSATIPVIVSSGYIQFPFTKGRNQDQFCAYLEKPYSPAKLISTIEKCIKGDAYDK